MKCRTAHTYMPPTCDINYINTQDINVNVRLTYVNITCKIIQHN